MDIYNYVTYAQFINDLKGLSSGEEFCSFSKKIIKTNKQIVGIRTPDLKKLVKCFGKESEHKFLNDYKGVYYEEVLLKGMLIAKEKEFEKATRLLNEFYQDIDNWAVVDMVAGYINFVKYTDEDNAFKYFSGLLKSNEEFIVRFGIVCLMKYFLNEKYLESTLNEIYKVICGKYYIDMAIAWLLSEVIIKYPQKAIKIMQKIIKNNHFNTFIINKGIQKARESYRVSAKLKEELKEMKIKC